METDAGGPSSSESEDHFLLWLEYKISERGLYIAPTDREATARLLKSTIGSVAEGVLSRAAAAVCGEKRRKPDSDEASLPSHSPSREASSSAMDYTGKSKGPIAIPPAALRKPGSVAAESEDGNRAGKKRRIDSVALKHALTPAPAEAAIASDRAADIPLHLDVLPRQGAFEVDFIGTPKQTDDLDAFIKASTLVGFEHKLLERLIASPGDTIFPWLMHYIGARQAAVQVLQPQISSSGPPFLGQSPRAASAQPASSSAKMVSSSLPVLSSSSTAHIISKGSSYTVSHVKGSSVLCPAGTHHRIQSMISVALRAGNMDQDQASLCTCTSQRLSLPVALWACVSYPTKPGDSPRKIDSGPAYCLMQVHSAFGKAWKDMIDFCTLKSVANDRFKIILNVVAGDHSSTIHYFDVPSASLEQCKATGADRACANDEVQFCNRSQPDKKLNLSWYALFPRLLDTILETANRSSCFLHEFDEALLVLKGPSMQANQLLVLLLCIGIKYIRVTL